MVVDNLGRSFKTLRVSLTSRCNLGCVYCVSSEEDKILKKATPHFYEGYDKQENSTISELTNSQYLRIIGRLHSVLGLDTIRLTGGEPFLYKDIASLIKGLNSLEIPKVKITTNGYLLANWIPRIAHMNISSINISIDTLDEHTHYKISRRKNLQKIIEGIDAALDAGFRVKLNVVALKGLNDKDIIPLLEFAMERKVVIRFLEIMKMGPFYEGVGSYFYSEDEILRNISQKFQFDPEGRKSNATSKYWNIRGVDFKFGIIANESSPFCADCNRLRLDSYGKIYGCLSSNEGLDILSNVDDESMVKELLSSALRQKQSYKFMGSEMSMKSIGG